MKIQTVSLKTIRYFIQCKDKEGIWYDFAEREDKDKVRARINELKTERPQRSFRGIKRTILDEMFD